MMRLLLLLFFVTACFCFQPRHVAIPIRHQQQRGEEARMFSFTSSHRYPAGFYLHNRGTKYYASEINVIAHSSTAASPPKFTLNLANQLTISRICAIPFFMIALVMRKVYLPRQYCNVHITYLYCSLTCTDHIHMTVIINIFSFRYDRNPLPY